MIFRKIAVFGAIALTCTAPLANAAPDPESFRAQVDSVVQAEMQREDVPGVAIAVLHNGEVILAKGYGKATLEHNVPVTPDTIFQSGSIGKMFTAVSVMKLVEAGKMRLDDPITNYLPSAPERWKSITIRHLLTHTSGVADGDKFNLRADYSDEELAKLCFSLPLEFAAGSRWNYSNTGYVLLGIIVNQAAARSYLDIIDSEVFKPLGMKTARGISDADIVPNRASGYARVDGGLKNQDWVSPSFNRTADGSLYLSLNDMISWEKGVERGAILSSASWNQIYSPVRLTSGKTYPYGFGWMLESTATGQARRYHSGGWQGFSTFYSRYLGDGLSVIVLANTDDANVELFTERVAGLWDPSIVAAAPRPKAEPEISRRLTALIEKARAGALRDEDLPLAGTDYAQKVNSYLATSFKSIGPLTRLELTERRELGDDTVYTFAAAFGDRRTTIKYGLAPGNKVSVFRVLE